jgi:predicted nucleotidyltransferase
MNKQEIFEKIIKFLKNEGAKRISVFGSYVRGEEKRESDIDIIVEFSERKSLLELVRIERELSEFLGIKVDLLTEQSISPYLIDSIRKEMEVIYEGYSCIEKEINGY